MAKTPPPAPNGTIADWLQDVLLRGLIWAMLRLPLTLQLRVMGAFVARVLAPIVGYRKRAEANLAFVWPDMPAAQRRAIANAVADNAGRTMIENYDPDGLRSRMALVTPEGEGVAAMDAARAAGRPILFITGHYGNFEAPRAALVARGWQIGGLYRPMTNPYFNAHYAQNMHALSGPVFPQGPRGTLGLIKHIRQGGMGVLLFDIYSGKGEMIEFMGRTAPTLTSAAEIALKTDALLVPFFGIRHSDGQSFRAVFEAPIPHSTPREMMIEATKRLEARVQEDPTQWFWIHRRWKPEKVARIQRKRAAAKMGP